MKKLFVAAGLLAAIGSANAYDLGVTAGVGTTGGGLHLVVPVVENTLNARAGINYFSYSSDFNSGDVKYDGKLKLQTFDLLLDYYPFGGAFRITAGGIINDNKVTASAKANGGDFTFNGNTYNASQVGQVDGKITFNKFAPYLGIGWGNAVAKDKGFGFASELGVMFMGSPKTSLGVSGCTLPAAGACDTLRNDVAAEAGKLNDKAKDIKYYPVARIALTYKF